MLKQLRLRLSPVPVAVLKVIVAADLGNVLRERRPIRPSESIRNNGDDVALRLNRMRDLTPNAILVS